MDVLTDPFGTAIAQRATIELILLGLACGPLGVWIVLNRQSYAAESIAHGTLPGLVLASLAGIPLLVGAVGGLAVAAAAIALAGRVRGVGQDAAVAVAVTTLFGAGVLLALQPDVPPRLGEILFGNPLGVTGADLIATAILAALVAAALVGFGRAFALSAFDPPSAPSLGTLPVRADLALLALLAVATLVAIQAIGNLLVVALLVAPGATALRLTSRLPTALALAAALAIAAGIAGIYASHYLDIAAGAAVALSAVTLFALALLR